MTIALVLIIKAVAYFALIRFTIVRLGRFTGDPTPRAIALTAARLGISLILLLPLWALSTELAQVLGGSDAGEYAAYFVVYAALRWMAWSVISLWIFEGPRNLEAIFFGRSRAESGWRLAAVALSFICDLPMLTLNGGPMIGKLFC